MGIKKLNLPSEVTTEILTLQNETIIKLNFGTHPKDVEYLHKEIERICKNELKTTEKFNNGFNSVHKHLMNKL